MGRAIRLIVICAAGVGAAACYRVIPSPHPPYTVTGIVEAVDGEAMALRHKSGQRIRIALVPGTAVSRHDSPAAVADIAVGMRIVVVYRFVGDTPVADEVHLFRPPIKPVT